MVLNFQPLYFDTHCHLFFDQFKSDLNQIIKKCYSKGILLLVAGIDYETSLQAQELAEKYENIYFAVGLHPTSCEGKEQNLRKHLNNLLQLPLHPKLVAIGETGLDHYWHPEWDIVMVDLFKQHIELSRETNLPLIIHSRGNDNRTAEILDKYAKNTSGVLHCFNGSSDLYSIGEVLGYYFSFAGNVTYPKANDLREWVLRIPCDRICCETDAPYLAPQVYRGKRNEPTFVDTIADFLIKLRSDLTYNDFVSNGLNLFKLR